MKKEVIQTFIYMSIFFWILLSIIFVYQDLKKQIDRIEINSNNDIFIEDRIYYQEQLWNISEKINRIEANTKNIAEQLLIDYIIITE